MSALVCPVCSGAFREVLRDGVQIDVCTQCRGVWLDRGELERLLAAEDARGATPLSQSRGYDDDDHDHGSDRRKHGREDDHGYRSGHKRKRKTKFLDFFDL